jgi:hypothetical protein
LLLAKKMTAADAEVGRGEKLFSPGNATGTLARVAAHGEVVGLDRQPVAQSSRMKAATAAKSDVPSAAYIGELLKVMSAAMVPQRISEADRYVLCEQPHRKLCICGAPHVHGCVHRCVCTDACMGVCSSCSVCKRLRS